MLAQRSNSTKFFWEPFFRSIMENSCFEIFHKILRKARARKSIFSNATGGKPLPVLKLKTLTWVFFWQFYIASNSFLILISKRNTHQKISNQFYMIFKTAVFKNTCLFRKFSKIYIGAGKSCIWDGMSTSKCLFWNAKNLVVKLMISTTNGVSL